MDRLPQDDLSRQRRLNQGRCPEHGLVLSPGDVLEDGIVFECPLNTCEFQHCPKPGTKSYAKLFPGKRRA